MKLVSIIIAYNPDINELNHNILKCLPDVDKLLIYQNSIVDQDILKISDKIVLLGDGINIGIASALNAGVRWAMLNKFTHILTLDQDSYFKDGHLAIYKSLVNSTAFNDIGVYGINPNNRGSLLFDSDELYVEVSDTITSGSIFPINVFIKYGLFEDALFIDAVDYEYCYRLKTQGNLKTIIFPSIVLEHKVGDVTKTWLGFKTDNYPAFRTYFIIRNQIIMWLRYPNLFPKQHKIILVKVHIINRVVKILLAEQDKFSKLKAIFRGIYHGIKQITGYR